MYPSHVLSISVLQDFFFLVFFSFKLSLVFYHSIDRLCRSLPYSPHGSDHLVNINAPSEGHFSHAEVLATFFFFFSILILTGLPGYAATHADVRKGGQLFSFSGKQLCNSVISALELSPAAPLRISSELESESSFL